jgi:hypothetical protein
MHKVKVEIGAVPRVAFGLSHRLVTVTAERRARPALPSRRGPSSGFRACHGGLRQPDAKRVPAGARKPADLPRRAFFIRRLAIVRGDLAKELWWQDRLPGAWPTGRHVLKTRHSAQSSRISARAHRVSSLRRTLPRQSKVERTYHGDRPTDATDPTLTLARGAYSDLGESASGLRGS